MCEVSLKTKVKEKIEVYMRIHEVGLRVVLLDPGRRVGSLLGRSRCVTWMGGLKESDQGILILYEVG